MLVAELPPQLINWLYCHELDHWSLVYENMVHSMNVR